MLKNLRLSTQFVGIALIALLSMGCLAALSALTLKDSLLKERMHLTKSAVEVVYAMISTEAARAEAAGDSVESAQQLILDNILNTWYADNEYFFVINIEGLILANPSNGSQGQNVFNSKDASGKYFVQDIIETSGVNGGGFTSYYYSRVNSDVPEPKISYSTRYEPWGWVIGTGLYVDDINKLFYQRLIYSACFLVFAMLAMLALSAMAVRQNKRSINMILTQIGKLGEKEFESDHRDLHDIPENEFGDILRSVFKARDLLIEKLTARSKNENNRVRQVLDQASSPLCLADSDRNIVYANTAARKMFSDMQASLKDNCPQFSGDDTSNLRLEQLHPDPDDFIARLNAATDSLHDQLHIGKHHLCCVTTRIIDGSGDNKVSGYVAECLDVTEQLAHNKKIEEQAKLERQKSECIQQRVDSVLEAVSTASTGDLRGDISVGGDDAVGVMGASLGTFIERLRDNFLVIGEHVSSISEATGSLASTANELGENADSTATQASTASRSAATINAAVDSVSSATSQMSSSIRDIAANTNTAATVAQEAVELAGSTDQSMRQLAESSNKIGQVIKVINSIAEQTNLLALNATIEAARAGDAGKGFAVVAGEVKELAKETAKATEDIQSIIESIQSDTQSAVTANSTILDTVSQINAIQTDISAAVEQQMNTTREITQSVQEAAEGCGEVVKNVSQTATTADEARSTARASREAIEHLTTLASELDELLASYKVK